MIVSEIEARIQTVQAIRTMAGIHEPSHSSLMSQEYVAARLFQNYGILPTIGCEIEVTASSLMPEVFAILGERGADGRFKKSYKQLDKTQKALFDTRYAEKDERLLPRFQLAEKLGIPHIGHDAYWEFSHDPTYDWRTLAEEVEGVFESRLAPKGFEHSLHITLGAVAVEGGGACLVTSGIEYLHGQSSRFRQATTSKMANGSIWARRGKDGMHERSELSCQLGVDVATEIRTMSTDSAERTAAILRSAQLLGSILLGFRLRDRSTTPAKLPDLWREYRQLIHGLWDEIGVPATSWGRPHHHQEHWLAWADALDNRESAVGRSFMDGCNAILQKTEVTLEELALDDLVVSEM